MNVVNFFQGLSEHHNYVVTISTLGTFFQKVNESNRKYFGSVPVILSETVAKNLATELFGIR